MEHLFTFDLFIINIPIYLACIIAGFMLAIKPKYNKKNRIKSFSEELYDKNELKLNKIEDFDLYLQLAKLSRKNGEFDKSVQIHKKLLEQANIPKNLESKIIFELGKDYLASGLLDKAEENLVMSLQITDKSSDKYKLCLVELSKLYERQMNWSKALVYRKKLAKIDDSYNNGLALLLCNLAKEEFIQKNIGNSKKLYLEALDLNKECVLAVKELAIIYISEENYDDTFKIVNDYIKTSHKLLNILSFALTNLLNNDDYKEKTITLIEDLIQTQSCDYSISILYCNYLLNSNKSEDLTKFISTYNEKYKDELQAIYAMAVFLKETNFDYKNKNSSNIFLEKVENMLNQSYNYQCSKCGYHTKKEFWHCPQCQEWDTIDNIKK